MTEELKEENKCNCDKKELKRFLLTILGSFLGCLVALCLYSAAVKPQPPMPMGPCPCALQKMHRPEVPIFEDNRGPHPEFKINQDKHSPFHRPDMRPEVKK